MITALFVRNAPSCCPLRYKRLRGRRAGPNPDLHLLDPPRQHLSTHPSQTSTELKTSQHAASLPYHRRKLRSRVSDVFAFRPCRLVLIFSIRVSAAVQSARPQHRNWRCCVFMDQSVQPGTAHLTPTCPSLAISRELDPSKQGLCEWRTFPLAASSDTSHWQTDSRRTPPGHSFFESDISGYS